MGRDCSVCGREVTAGSGVPSIPGVHRTCHYNRVKEWGSTNPEARKRIYDRSRLKTTYGLSKEEADWVLDYDGACFLCGGYSSDGKRLHVDHCHETGKVRGLLCNHCNRGVGCFRDQPDLMRMAADYLQSPPGVAAGDVELTA